MICQKCKLGKARLQRGLYHYLESGLPNIKLKNVKWWKCPKCQATEVEIPKVGQLHRCLGWMIVTKSSLLTGPEIVFLRRLVGKSQKDMAAYLGISQVVLSRWETESRKSHSKANDSIVRLSYLALQDDEYTHKINRELQRLLMPYFGNIKDQAYPVRAQIDPQHCEPQKVVDNSFVLIANVAKQTARAIACR